MKSLFKSTLLLAALGLLISNVSCKGGDGDDPPGPTQNVHEYLTSAGGYTMFLAAIDKFGLKVQLSTAGSFTLLAVTDNQLVADNIDLAAMSDSEAEIFIKYHFFARTIKPADFPNNGYVSTESPGGPNGKKLSIFTEVIGENVRFNGKNYIEKIAATNGMIYKMEGSLSPPTVLEALGYNPNIKTYKVAVNLEAAVKTSLGNGPNTVFATSETKFVAYLNANNTTITSLSPSERRKILNNSIIPAANKLTSDLSATEKTKGEDLLVTESGGTVTLNGKSTITKANGQCKDGVIHVISDLLN